MGTFCTIISRTNRWVGLAISLLTLAMVATAFLEVMLRYGFNRPTIWVWDLNIQLLCAMVFLGAGYTLLEGGHVNVDVVVSRLSGRTKAILNLITFWAFLGGTAIFLWQSSEAGWQSFLERESYWGIWKPPLYPLKMLLPIGIFLLMLQGTVKFVNDLRVATHKMN